MWCFRYRGHHRRGLYDPEKLSLPFSSRINLCVCPEEEEPMQKNHNNIGETAVVSGTKEK